MGYVLGSEIIIPVLLCGAVLYACWPVSKMRKDFYICAECEEEVDKLCLTCYACYGCCDCEPEENENGDVSDETLAS